MPLVKIQRSLYSSGPPTLLTYDENHSFLVACPLTDEHVSWFKKDEYKFFGSVEVRDDPVDVKILSRVGNQDAFDW